MSYLLNPDQQLQEAEMMPSVQYPFQWTLYVYIINHYRTKVRYLNNSKPASLVYNSNYLQPVAATRTNVMNSPQRAQEVKGKYGMQAHAAQRRQHVLTVYMKYIEDVVLTRNLPKDLTYLAR